MTEFKFLWSLSL